MGALRRLRPVPEPELPTFTPRETCWLVALAARADPDTAPCPEAAAVIYKARALVEPLPGGHGVRVGQFWVSAK